MAICKPQRERVEGQLADYNLIIDSSLGNQSYLCLFVLNIGDFLTFDLTLTLI